MEFNRNNYYSQTDVVKKYRISIIKYKQLIQDNNIPIESFEADLGGYKVKTVYVSKEVIDALKIALR